MIEYSVVMLYFVITQPSVQIKFVVIRDLV